MAGKCTLTLLSYQQADKETDIFVSDLLHKALGKPSLKKREYIKTFDLKEGGGQFENLFIQK